MSDKIVDGSALKALRMKAGMTVPGLSSRSTYIGKDGQEKHVSPATIASYESGRRTKASETTLMGLAKGLGMDFSEIGKALIQAPGAPHVSESPSASAPAPDA